MKLNSIFFLLLSIPLAVFGQYGYISGVVLTEVGEGVEFVNVMISETGAGGGTDSVGKFNISENIFLRTSYERAWRIPEFYQFFGNGNVIIPNIDLKPESSDNFNIGGRTEISAGELVSIDIELNGFLRDQNDIIFFNPENF